MALEEIVTEIDVATAPDRLWRVLTDFAAYPSWNPFLREIRGSLTDGEKLEVTILLHGRRARVFKPRIVRIVSLRELRWRGRFGFPGMLGGEHYFLLDQKSDHRTRLVNGAEVSGLLAGRSKKALEQAQRGMEAMNFAVKKRAELLGAPEVFDLRARRPAP